MTDHSIFWIGMTIYSVGLLLSLYMTRMEQTENNIPWRQAIVGFTGCVLWPLTLALFALFILRGAERD